MPWRALLLVGILSGLSAALPVAQPPPRPLPGREVYRRSLSAVAWVHGTGRGKGSGWIVDQQRRWLVTCYHVVGDAGTATVVFPDGQPHEPISDRQHYLTRLPELRQKGRVVTGRVLGSDPGTDLALVELDRLPEGTTALPLATGQARLGDRVHLIGNRYDTDVLWTHATGTIRARRTLREGYWNAGKQLARGARTLLADLPINEGDSGGPLLDERGEVVGVASAVAWDVQGAGVFIGIEEIRELLKGERGRVSAPPSGERKPPSSADIYQRAVPGVVLVGLEGGSRQAGVLLDRQRGLLATTAQAVGQEKSVEVIFPVEQAEKRIVEVAWYVQENDLLRRKGLRLEAVVLVVDTRRNLALLEVARVPPGCTALALAEKEPRPGDALQFISHPRRLNVLWVHGSASLRQVGHTNLGQTKEGPDPAVLLVQASLGEGEGGGPVLDSRGQLVGLLTGQSAAQQQVGYALSGGELRQLWREHQSRLEPRTALDYYQRGQIFVEARQYEQAEKAYLAAVEREKGLALAWCELAHARSLMGQYGLALEAANRVLAAEPNLAWARCRRAEALYGLGDWHRARADLDEALRLAPRCALAFALRAKARWRGQQLDQALADCDEAIWLDGRLALAYQLRGIIHGQKRALVQALHDLGRAIALDPADPVNYRERALLHLHADQQESALADFTACLLRTPDEFLEGHHLQLLTGLAATLPESILKQQVVAGLKAVAGKKGQAREQKLQFLLREIRSGWHVR